MAIVAAEPHRPYQRPPLSKGYLRGEEGEDEVFLQPADYYAAQRITLLPETRATAIRRDDHELLLSTGELIRYEKLLLATGGRPRHLPIPGADLPGVYLLRRIEDSEQIRAAGQRASPASPSRAASSPRRSPRPQSDGRAGRDGLPEPHILGRV